MNLRELIKKDLAAALQQTIDTGEIEVTRSADARFGDYTSNIALRLSRFANSQKPKAYHSPIEIAKILADSLKSQPYLEKLEVCKPGFINFFIKDSVWQKEVDNLLKKGVGFGSNDLGKGKKARVEFVSANPTGPLHFGNARGGPIGDVLASVFEFSGYKVLREYYHNDVGVQVEKLGRSILNVVAGRPLEEQEYKGEYIKEFASKISTQILEKSRPTGVTSPSLDWDRLGKEAVDKLLTEILADCEAMGIKFNKVYVESEFAASGQTQKALDFLSKKKVLKKQEGATWFVPSDEFLKDRETVVVKSDGDLTYFANDIAYHRLKFAEKYDLVVDILGANHHGHVPRLKAVIQSLDYDTDKLKIILYQWVRFKRGGEVVKMSKRSGTFVTVREILDEVGRDALRFFILMHDANTHIDFDLDLARERSSKNPVYYVQYAYARICSILAKSKVKSPASPAGGQKSKVNCELLTTNYELALIKQISRLPEFVEDIAQSFAVNQLTTYATELADSFHKFYENCQVLSDDHDLRSARLALISATRITLSNVLKLLGISAPEKM